MTSSSALPSPPTVEAAEDGDRNAVELAHDELRGGGDLVRDRDHRRVELVAGRVAFADVLADDGDAGGAERDVGGAAAPGTAERVGDDHADVAAGVRAQRLAQQGGGRVGIERQQHERAALRRVRRVDAGRRADEAVARLADDERRPHPDDALRLLQDRLDPARVRLVLRVGGGDLARLLRRLVVVEPHDAALDLRDRLLRDDDDVPVLEVDPVRDQRGEVVALAQLRDAFDREGGESAHGRPTTRTPAWPL